MGPTPLAQRDQQRIGMSEITPEAEIARTTDFGSD
jgi:hypothetical protein